MFQITSDYLVTLPAFILFFLGALALTALFVAVYAMITPWREITLIRANNTAAAISLGGAVFGLVIPLASVIANSLSLAEMLVWGIIAMVVQLLTLLIARLVLPDLRRGIEAGETAPALTLAFLAVAIGILNAACLVY